MYKKHGYSLALVAGLFVMANASCGEPSEMSVDADVTSIGSASQELGGLDAGLSSWTDYRLSFALRTQAGSWGGGQFRLVDDDNYYRFRCKAGSGDARLERVQDGIVTVLSQRNMLECKGDGAHTVVIEAVGTLLSASVNGGEALRANDDTYATGGVALYGEGGRRAPCTSTGHNDDEKGKSKGKDKGTTKPCPASPGKRHGNGPPVTFDTIRVEELPSGVSTLMEDFDDGGYPNWAVVDSNPSAPSEWVVIAGALTYHSAVGDAGGSFLRFAAGTCGDGILQPGEACERGVGCNQRCQPGSACEGVDCSGLDSACMIGTCDEVSWQCYAVASNEGGACDDGAACTKSDTCTAGRCAGTTYACDDGNDCTTDACNGDGTCSTAPVANATSCDDGVACTQNDVCTAGSCSGTAYTCDDGESCTNDSCNGDGTCTSAAVADGTACDHGSACGQGDECVAGVCDGGASVPCVPPDPATVAPPLDPYVSASFDDQVSFLYTGADAIQSGVSPGTIDPKRTTVIRGRVLDRSGSPLPSVRVTILDHPELGYTLSRDDGRYDLVVNGGGHLTVDLRYVGYLSSQRKVHTAWNDWVHVDDVMLVELDPIVTVVDLSGSATALQVATGSVESDADGARQARVIFPAGTSATMTLPDGTVQALSTVSVRATEYTVGPDGPKAMPGTLPPMSGYTYAVELSVDEALAYGATRVDFNQPVAFYVENFIGFPVGQAVPTGYYDRQQGIWIAAPNGRVVGILTIDSGIAELDIDGTGVAATAAALAALGVSDSERTKLAKIYAVGDSLWRVAMDHFTPWDHNWPAMPTAGSEFPPTSLVNQAALTDCDKQVAGSIIGVHDRTLGESVGVPGTSFSLRYSSQHESGYAKGLTIPLVDSTPPDRLRGIEVSFEVAGRKEVFSHGAVVPSQTQSFEWDGLDAYGRVVPDAQRARVKVSGVYDLVYEDPGVSARAAFALPGDGTPAAITRTRDGAQVRKTRIHSVVLRPPARTGDVGNWTVSHHHRLASAGTRLIRGDGTTRDVGDSMTLSRVAGKIGTYLDKSSGNGGLAISAKFRFLDEVEVGPEGNVYVTEGCSIRRIGRDGIITKFAGAGCNFTYYNNGGPLGDGGLATAAPLNSPEGLAIDAAGNVYFVEPFVVPRIRKVDVATGIISTLAWKPGPEIVEPWSFDTLVVAPSGGWYISGNWDTTSGDYTGGVIYISPDGQGTVVVGGGTGPVFDGAVATEVKGSSFGRNQLALDADGRLILGKPSRDCGLYRLATSGLLERFAGNGGGYNCDRTNVWQGVDADRAISDTWRIAVGPRGRMFFLQKNYRECVRRIDPDGVIRRVAGDCENVSRSSGPVGPALAAKLRNIKDMAVGPDGTIYLTDSDASVVYKLSSDMVSTDGERRVNSVDGRQVFAFDENGKHLETRNRATGAVTASFTYNATGDLVGTTNASAEYTAIERDARGVATAIVSGGPSGARTSLGMTTNGRLASITAANGFGFSAAYSSGGLLQSFTNPLGRVASMGYDASGRLNSDTNTAGGGWGLASAKVGNARTVTMTSGAGLATTYGKETRSDGSSVRTVVLPTGLRASSTYVPGGAFTSTRSDGTTITREKTADPRFRGNVQRAKSLTRTMPSGLSQHAAFDHQVVLSDPNDRMSMTSETRTATVAGLTTTYVKDHVNRTSTMTTPMGRPIIKTYDTKGRVVSAQSLGREPVMVTRDAEGRRAATTQGTGAAARSRTNTYGSDGFVSSMTGTDGKTTSYVRTAAGAVAQMTTDDGRVVSFERDSLGQTTGVTTPRGHVHGFKYTVDGHLVSYTAPDVGAGSTTTNYVVTDGQVTQSTLPDGQVVRHTYDSFGRYTSTVSDRGTWLAAYSPTTGHKTVVTNPELDTIAYTYDGALLTAETWAGAVTGSVGITFDSSLRVSSSTAAGSTVNYQYDDDSDLVGAGALAIGRGIGDAGVATTTLGSVTSARSYNGFGESASTAWRFGAVDVYAETIGRDVAGRVVQRTEATSAGTTVFNYTYDAADRLWEVRRDGSLVATYTYDASGNRLTRTAGGTTEVGIYDAQDRATSYGGSTYTYSASGNLTSRNSGGALTLFDYDARGNLLAVQLADGRRVQYHVDAANRRVGRSVDGVLTNGWLYNDQLTIAAEVDAAGALVTRFVHDGSGTLPAYMVRGGVTYQFIADHLGSPRMVVDVATGTIAQRMEFDEFGRVTLDTNPGFQPFGFAGGIYDVDTKLVRFGARDYDATLGRFTAKDPTRFGGGGTNFYAYVDNDPVNLVDPTGRIGITFDNKAGVSVDVGPTVSVSVKRSLKNASSTSLTLSAKTSKATGWYGGFGIYDKTGGLSGVKAGVFLNVKIGIKVKLAVGPYIDFKEGSWVPKEFGISFEPGVTEKGTTATASVPIKINIMADPNGPIVRWTTEQLWKTFGDDLPDEEPFKLDPQVGECPDPNLAGTGTEEKFGDLEDILGWIRYQRQKGGLDPRGSNWPALSKKYADYTN